MLTPGAIIYPLVFALGSVVGSFLNVCIYRLPRDRSVVSPPSHCPKCGARLRAADLVPLLSFLALARKCRSCGNPIPWRYFLVELITGLVFVLVWIVSGPGPQVLPAWIFSSTMIAVVFTDLDHMIIPDKLVLGALAAALLSEALLVARATTPLLSVPVPGTDSALPRFLAGGGLGVAAFVFIRAFSQLLFRREGMGLGDLKLAGAIGAMLGPAHALLSFGLAIGVGAMLGVALLLLRLRRRMEYLPFGPFLALSSLTVLLAPRYLDEMTRDLCTRWLAVFGA